MAVFTFYDKFKENMIDGSSVIAFGSDTIKIALTTVSYTPASTDEFFTVPVAFEVSGTNYVAGGATTTAVVSGGTTTTTKVTFSNVTWLQNAGGFTNAQYMVIYKSTGTNSTSPLISYYNIGSSVGNVAGDLVISFDATNGAFTLQ